MDHFLHTPEGIQCICSIIKSLRYHSAVYIKFAAKVLQNVKQLPQAYGQCHREESQSDCELWE